MLNTLRTPTKKAAIMMHKCKLTVLKTMLKEDYAILVDEPLRAPHNRAREQRETRTDFVIMVHTRSRKDVVCTEKVPHVMRVHGALSLALFP